MSRARLDPPPGFDDPPRGHQEIVAERLADHRANPTAAQPAEALFEDLASKLDNGG